MAKKKVIADPVEDQALKEYRDLMIYLGQLEYNIVNNTETLNNMQMEKLKTINKIRELEGHLNIDSSSM